MKAIFLHETGSPDVLKYGDLPDPIAKPGEMLVRIRAVSINPIDTYIRNGANYWPLPKPFIPGSDFAGEVVQLGEGAKGFSIGDRVWGSNQGLLGRQGSFCELASIDPQWIYPLPDNVSFEQAAACALVGITAHLGLFGHANLKEGETIFVRGGTGGVGAMVLQMAKACGCRVITTAGNETKAQRCRGLGADDVIIHSAESVADRLKELAPQGVNVFWETLRDPDFDLAVSTMAERGRMVLMAGRDARPPFPVGPFYVKGCSLHGFAMFKASSEEQRRAANDINHWLSTGKLNAQIDRVLPLAQAAEGHRLQEASTVQKSGGLAGKIVLTID